MAVLLGSSGQIELRRTGLGDTYQSVVDPSDVNASRNRFSFDFPAGMLLTGDQVQIKALDGGPLSFVAPSGWAVPGAYPDGNWFIHVDEVGGVRLYRRFDDAVSGERDGRVDLLTPDRSIPVSVTVRNNVERIVGQVTDFTLNTSREAVDVTELGDEFRQQYSALISGSGQLNCFFDYERRMCDNLSEASSNVIEMPIYMHQLLLRTRLGSSFRSKLTLVCRGPKPGSFQEDLDDEVWYEFDGLVTNVAIAFEPTQPVRTTVDFVTTGEVKLRTRMISNYIVQEQDGFSRLRVEEMMGNDFLELEEAQQE